MTHKLQHQPYSTIQSEPTPNYHGIALNNAAVISDFSKVLDDRNKEIAELRDFIKGIAKHDFNLSDMCPHKVHEAARKMLGWPIEEGGE